MLESSLRRKFELELDQIPLPAAELWFPSTETRRGGMGRILVAALAAALLMAAVSVASGRLMAKPQTEPVNSTNVLSPSRVAIHIPSSFAAPGPAALDACQVIARAASSLGMVSIASPGRVESGGVVFEHADGPWGSRPCAFGWDGGWADPHLLIRPQPTSSAEAEALVPQTFAADRPTWAADTAGIWIAHGGATSTSAAWDAVAVSAEPYFLVVTGRDEETARRLMQAVLDELGRF